MKRERQPLQPFGVLGAGICIVATTPQANGQTAYLIGPVRSVFGALLAHVKYTLVGIVAVAKYLVVWQHVIDDCRVSVGAPQRDGTADLLDSK